MGSLSIEEHCRLGMLLKEIRAKLSHDLGNIRGLTEQKGSKENIAINHLDRLRNKLDEILSRDEASRFKEEILANVYYGDLGRIDPKELPLHEL